MAGLRDLVAGQPERPSRRPAWLGRAIAVGIVSRDPDIRRRQAFANIAAYAAALNALSHFVANGLNHFEALLPVNLYNFAVAVLALLAHRLHRYGENVAAVFLCALIIVGHTWVVFAFGLGSGLQIYFTLAGAMLFLFGVQHWRLFAVFCLAAFAALLLSLTHASPAGFVMPEGEAFRDVLRVQGLINTFIVNALLICYALTALRRAQLDLARAYARSEALLGVMLPPAIAERLKSGRERRIADRVDCASILFADIAGFTPAASAAPPEEVVGYLHDLVSVFDDLCARHGADKIKTIGDSYMAVAGLRAGPREGAVAAGGLALAMLNAMDGVPSLAGHRLALRIGIHCGPVVAGVIGDTRVSYDVWGDAVNVAKRMESCSEPGRILVSDSFANLAADAFRLAPAGTREIKGVGSRKTWFLMCDL